MPVAGSTAAPVQFAPPVDPGRWIVPATDGGVKTGPVRKLFTASTAIAWISGVKSTRSFSSDPENSNGAGLLGIGCVGDAFSPGTSEAGTGFSSIGHTGLPVTRSNV